MEEIYILPDGSNIDISDYSESERLSFLVKNPKAKKQKGAAKSATAAPVRTIAQKKPMGSTSVVGSSGSKKFRLATEGDLQTQQKRGLMPPPSATPTSTVDTKDLYGGRKTENYDDLIRLVKPTIEKDFNKRFEKIPVKNKKDLNNIYSLKQNSTELVDSEEKISEIKEKIKNTDSELINPYLYYSSLDEEQPDTFVKDNYNDVELEKLGINIKDFDGFLNKKGYKTDYLEKESKGLFEGEGRGLSGYDIGLAKELAKKKLLNMYMEDMQQRDFTRQDLNQEIEIAAGFRKEKEIVKNQLFDQNGMVKYMEKNFPMLTQTLKDRDKENAKLYQESKKGGSDFFSWETPGKMVKAGFNAITDRIAQVSSTVYDVVGLDTAAEGIRMLDEENKLVKPLDRGVSYVSGKTVEYDGTKYIVDSKGEIYDTDAKIRVTDLFDDNMHKKLIEDSKYGSSDWMFSTQGAAVQTSGVMADMLLQAAVTKGVGSFGAIASASRTALIGAGRTNKITSLLNDTSQLLRKVPLDRGVGYSMIGQGALGYSQGYEETLKAARDNGINDAQAFKLANAAAQRMAVLYSTTGVINPQVDLAENVFGSKNIIKKAIDQYMKVGEKGFVNYIDDIIKSTPRNLIEFAEEGGKEVIQENIQQVGEIGVNKMTNRDAGKKIMNDVMSGDDFMNTSILSFISSGLISKAKLPSFKRGDESFDDLRSLNTLAKNKKEFTKSIDNLVAKKIFTKEQSDNLKADVDIYSNNINKLMKTTPPDAAMPIMRELDKVTKLTDEKQTVDKAFHGQIDEKIEAIRANMNKIYYESELKVKNEAIEKAIKKGVAKGVSMKSLSTTQEVQNYLVNEIGMPQKTAEIYSEQPGFALNSETLKKYSKDPNSISDKSQVIVVNESLTRDAGVIQHEFLHGVLQNTLKDSPEAQKLVGKALATEIRKMNDELILKGSSERTMPDWFFQRMDQYTKRDTKSRADAILEYKGKLADAKGDPSKIAAIEAKHKDKLAALEGVVWEEALTIYSDALRRGYVTYNESTFTKLGDVIRRVLQRLGIKDIKFNSGKDVYNFIKDYNNSVETGNWGKALTKMSNKGAEINIKPEGAKKVEPVKPKPEFSTTEKFSLGEKKSSENIKKDVNKNYDKEKWSVGSTRGRDENPAIERVLFDILGEYDYIIRGKAKTLGFANVPGYNDLDMISETYVQLIPHIRNFNKEFFQKREEYKKELEAKGLDPNSKEFKDKVETQDEKGYKGKNGVVKENDDLNAWINSQLVNKMNGAMKSGNVSEQVFSEDVEGEMFKESKISDGFGGDDSYLRDEGDSTFETNDEFEAQQDRLAVLLRDPVFRFVDEKGVPVQIETIPFGGLYISSASDKEVPANIKLKTETDPVKIAELKKELKDLERGLELKEKKDITFEEKEELKKLQSFKSFDLSSGDVINTFKALSTLDTPTRIVVEDVAEEILRSPNIQTLEYRNFKENLADRSKTMMKRITFEHGPGLESLMYNEWKLIYDVINHPMDPVTGQSSYASKKLPPTLKEFDDKGRLRKIGDITRVKFLQAYYKVDEVEKIIKKYGGKNATKELKQLEPEEVNKVTGQPLAQNTHFDRRTALRELFGDVMVLQEARRLIRDPQFLERVAERQVNLYNDLKDDVIRAEVLKDLSRGKSDIVKFSLAENEENKEFLNKFPNLLKSKEYQTFKNRVGDIYHSGSDIEKNWKKHDIKAIWFSAGDSQGWYGDGVLYKSNISDLPGSIVMPDWNRSGDAWNQRFAEKFPKVLDVLLKDMYDSGEGSQYLTDENGETLYDDDLTDITWEEYLKQKYPKIFKKTGGINFDDFIEYGEKFLKRDQYEKIAVDYIRRNDNRKPLLKQKTFEEYKNDLIKFNDTPTPGIFWLLQPKNIKYADKVILEYIKGFEEDPNAYLPYTEGGRNNPDGTLGNFTELIVIGPMQGYKMEKEVAERKFEPIKFSLAEEENGKLSPFLKGLPFTKQWVVARDIDRAINKAKMSSSAQQTEIDKLNAKISKTTDPVKIKELKEKISDLERFDKVTFKVPSKSNLSDEAIAYFIISKVAEGYNDFEFRVKRNASGPLTKQVLDNLDFKSKKAAEIRKLNSNLEEGMNQIIEENTGVEASETFSPETAKNLGKNIGKYDIFLPPEDEDFLGLLYTLASGKGKKGEEQMEFLKKALIEPYTDAMLKLMQARQVMYKDWRELINKKHKGITKVLKTDSGYGGYLNDQAVRVYLWRRAGYEIPGLDKKDVFNLQEIVRKNPELRKFAEDVSLLSKQANGYMEPDSNWGFGSVVGDINNIISKSNRQKYLEQWSSNVEKVFSKDNLSKIEAVYGRKYVIALKNTLDRMKTGTNRAEGSSDAFLNWLNGATAVTMFLNVRSAVLQTIGAVNYINTSDNNIAKAGLALLNVPQYTKDFFTLWNSDYLKDRRAGLTTDVVEAELAQTMNDPRNKSILDKFKAVNYLILKFGFNPTRLADSFAIAIGGAGFYRNRINTYKKQGMAEEDAINKTLRDFYDVSEVSQQSADVSKISMNQASTKGRILLSFMNTPFQYSRLIKKSAIDIIKGRGSIENNLAKIVYYGAVQNILFNALQNALFAMFLDDEEDQKSGKFDTAKIRTINGALDTFVRGMGMKGVLLSTFKNALMKAYEKKKDPKGYGDVLAEIANLSPSIGIKARGIVRAYKAVTYNLPEIKYKGFSIDNTHAIEAATSLTSALTNLPADRFYMKIQNIGNALSDEFNTWQRIAFLFGYNEWNLNPTAKRQVNSNASGGLKIPVLKTSELKQPGLKTP
jgi:hypothetical protein